MNGSYVIFQSALGVLVIPLLAWLLSERRRDVQLKLIIYSIGFQFGLALLLTGFPFSRHFFNAVNEGVLALDGATRAGTTFLFGYLGGGELPFRLEKNVSSFIMAFQALPLIIVLSALTSLLTYLKILPLVISLLAKALNRFLAISAPTAFASAANIFVGMVESPLFIKPYLKSLSRSELFVVMTVGMATIAGTVLVIYVGFLQKILPGAAGHLLTASIISIPAAISIALTMVPRSFDDGTSRAAPEALRDTENDDNTLERYSAHKSVTDAIVGGTQEGLSLCLQIAALLLVFVALVSLLNSLLATLVPNLFGTSLSLEGIIGIIMVPLAWLIGIPSGEILIAGELLGTKLVLNEFIALHALGALPADELSDRSITILSYALCGFANIGSLGILIGGLSTMAPTRRDDIISLAPKALISGTLSTLMTGAVIGLIN